MNGSLFHGQLVTLCCDVAVLLEGTEPRSNEGNARVHQK